VLPHGKIIVVTGPSGSGKSTLAFDVVFAEGQPSFLETLTPYARQFLPTLPRPDVDRVVGCRPRFALEQRTTRSGSTSTVATVTEIAHYLRLLFAKVGDAYCPRCDVPIATSTPEQAFARVRATAGPHELLAPAVVARKGTYLDVFTGAARAGISQAYADGVLVETMLRAPQEDAGAFDRFVVHRRRPRRRRSRYGRSSALVGQRRAQAATPRPRSAGRAGVRSCSSRRAACARGAATACPSSTRGSFRSRRSKASARLRGLGGRRFRTRRRPRPSRARLAKGHGSLRCRARNASEVSAIHEATGRSVKAALAWASGLAFEGAARRSPMRRRRSSGADSPSSTRSASATSARSARATLSGGEMQRLPPRRAARKRAHRRALRPRRATIGFIRAIRTDCCATFAPSPTWAARSSWWSTTRTRSVPPTISSISGRRAVARRPRHRARLTGCGARRPGVAHGARARGRARDGAAPHVARQERREHRPHGVRAHNLDVERLEIPSAGSRSSPGSAVGQEHARLARPVSGRAARARPRGRGAGRPRAHHRPEVDRPCARRRPVAHRSDSPQRPRDVPRHLRLIRKLYAASPDAKTRGFGPARFSFNTPKGDAARPATGRA